MTISSTTRLTQANGNGSTFTFPFAFKVFQASDLVVVSTVIATGVDTTLVLNSDYTVTLNADQNYNPGGNIVFGVAPLSTVKITITSAVPLLQPTDLSNQGGFYPDVINNSFDRSTIQIQQEHSDSSRALRAPVSDGVSTNMTIPGAALRANKYLAFDAAGLPLAAVGTNIPAISYAGQVDIVSNNGGTNDPNARDIVFKDNATELARIKGATGRVGIGTATPTQALDVVGTVNATSVTVANALASAAMASGSVLQVVNATTTTLYSLTTSYASSGLSVTITPKRSTSTIYLLVTPNLYTATTNTTADARVVRGATVVHEYIAAFGASGTGIIARGNYFIMAFDAPATTSATTYTLELKASSGATISMNLGGTPRSTMIAVEVAA